jgi:hypothetical protein
LTVSDLSGPSADVSAKLDALNAEVTREMAARRKSAETVRPVPAPTHRRKTAWLTMALVVTSFVVLPFVVLIGGAVWMYRVHAVPTWVALGFAGLLTAAILALYGGAISQKLTGEARVRFIFTRLALPVIVFYCAYTLLFLSRVNAKTEAVREYYTSVHPLLRVALSTAVLVDREIVVTDTRREAADYARMGLPTLDNSLHFRQQSGYVHAVDLRTVGRAGWRNFAMVSYFRLLGFKTLRHVGTADHLHVSLAPPGDLRR